MYNSRNILEIILVVVIRGQGQLFSCNLQLQIAVLLLREFFLFERIPSLNVSSTRGRLVARSLPACLRMDLPTLWKV